MTKTSGSVLDISVIFTVWSGLIFLLVDSLNSQWVSNWLESGLLEAPTVSVNSAIQQCPGQRMETITFSPHRFQPERNESHSDLFFNKWWQLAWRTEARLSQEGCRAGGWGRGLSRSSQSPSWGLFIQPECCCYNDRFQLSQLRFNTPERKRGKTHKGLILTQNKHP